ncbi:carboxymuconolactone decarboxylase family protein [Acidimangrovimonas pyrenivorans]|uniref:Carboxymuconolactone decarboxylase family protein n=1 Tax=Acidimangrovimonas pyrenivorans TaxID=2030798 RepID=A0ABV7AEJ4_9RHOB
MTTTDSRVDYADFTRILPGAQPALLALGKAAGDAGLDKALSELVKIRVSQINGCTFCLRYHLDLARGLGVAQDKLDLVACWRDAGLFDAREQAALAWAECLTEIGPDGVPEPLHAALRAVFTETEIVALTAAIATINAWNRLGVGLRFAPSLRSREAA